MFKVYFHTGRSWMLVGEYSDRESAKRSADYVLMHRRQGFKFMGHHPDSIKIENDRGAEYV